MRMSDNPKETRELLAQLVETAGLSLNALSKDLGKNAAYLQQYVKRGSPKVLPEAIINRLARRLRVDPRVLGGGASSDGEFEDARLIAAKRNESVLPEWSLGGETFVPVPLHDIRAAAGAGTFVEDGEPISYQVFRAGQLSRLSHAPLHMLSVIMVAGDSMAETLREGDQVLVDRSVRTFREEGIYVLLYNDVLLVKRLQHDIPNKAILLISDNPLYSKQQIKNPNDIMILGQVVWTGRALRRLS